MLTPSEPMAEVEVSAPARTPTTAPPWAAPSAPRMSLSSTLPVTVPPSITVALSDSAMGMSSTIWITMVLVTLLPSSSVAL
ncbi:hypothetical protein D3C77_495610 [compost metagenome]